MTRATRAVAKEIASVFDEIGEARFKMSQPDTTYLVGGLMLKSWADRLGKSLAMLCPPRKSPRMRSKGVKARRATVKELDKLCREVVFLRDGKECRHCGMAAGKLDWAHVYSRRFHSTRWALDGSMVLCRACHLWWHHAPTEAATWWQGEVGFSKAAHLAQLKRTTKTNLDLVRVYLLQEKKKLEAGTLNVPDLE